MLCLHTAGFMTAAVAMYEAAGFRRDPAHDFEATIELALEGVRPVPILAYRLELAPDHQVGPGEAHEFWNPTDEEVRVVVEVQPGERLVQLIRQLFLTGQDGRTDAAGRPRPLRAAVLAREFGDTMRFTSPPPAVQRAVSGLLAPIARLTGQRALDPAYLARELPVVDPEPLPGEIADRIPAIASQPIRSIR